MNIKNIILGTIGITIFISVCVLIYYMAFIEKTEYYTIIDNTKIEELNGVDDFKYKYTLESYTKDGKEKSISFETTRKLKESAYIKLNYMITRGVTSWEEVKYNDLPEKVKKYTNKKIRINFPNFLNT